MEVDMNVNDFSFFQLSSKQELALFLIERELRGLKLIEGLENIGFEASFVYPDLGLAILSVMEIDSQDNDLWEAYHEIMNASLDEVTLHDLNATSRVTRDVFRKLKAQSEKHT